jgi:hypothetical protein
MRRPVAGALRGTQALALTEPTGRLASTTRLASSAMSG